MPLLQIANSTKFEIGKFGGTIKGSIKPIQGWSELIDDLSWHQAHRDWRYKKEFHKHSLEVPIDLFE